MVLYIFTIQSHLIKRGNEKKEGILKKQLKEWQKFEEFIAEAIDGHRQKGSGNGPIQKGDVRAEDFLIECKYTSKEVYTLNYKTWEKICEESRNLGLIPLFACSSQAGNFLVMNEFDYCDLDMSFMVDDSNYQDVPEEPASKNIHIESPKKATIKGSRNNFDVVCFEINYEE